MMDMNSSVERTVRPSLAAFSYLDPGPPPATTWPVFALTLEPILSTADTALYFHCIS